MSEEHLKAFLEAVKADAGLQEKMKAAADADAVVVIAKAAGFVVTAEELKSAQAEVSEEELAALVGGKQTQQQMAEAKVQEQIAQLNAAAAANE